MELIRKFFSRKDDNKKNAKELEAKLEKGMTYTFAAYGEVLKDLEKYDRTASKSR